ncbi:MAG: hypothetical protein CVT67_09390 [Actinobacteria bacterium HGW-Actinobacteria-7]|jgi:3'-5' exoribonuclease|nr:MAG: hypothetical protein CVT67_09390 [Actinobacteria bacterium HGW-Actinobacteria-7]
MAKARYVSELAQGCKVEGVYVLRGKELRIARTGDAYLSLTLADRTGSIPAVHFRPSRAAVEIPASAVVFVRGTTTSFKGTRRVTVEAISPAEAWDPADLVAVGPRPLEELNCEFTSLVRLVSDTRLRQLLRNIFGDKTFFAQFSRCPATQNEHHDYVGGLIEHTVSVSSLCLELSGHYDALDRELLLTSSLVHDIGVVDSLRYDTGITDTDDGRLIGHAALGAFRVRDAARHTRLDGGLSVRLEHAVMSHHADSTGEGDRPITLEALVLQHADRIDAQVTGFSAVLSGAVRAEEGWTDDKNRFRRALCTTLPIRTNIQSDDARGARPVQRPA